MEGKERTHRTIHWFRKGLRLHDNEALLHAIQSSDVLFCVYILDIDWIKKNEKIGSNRMGFILECLKDLDQTLKSYGTRLFVLQGHSKTVIKQFCRDNDITQMTSLKDPEGYYKLLEADITAEVSRREIVTKSFHGQTLYDPNTINQANNGRTPLTKAEFDQSVSEIGNPRLPCPTPTAEMFKECNCEIQENHDAAYGIPTLEQLGFESNNEERLSQWPGGETQALERMQAKFENQENALYKRRVSREPRQMVRPPPPQQSSNQDLEPETTGLSAYLNFGALSVRTLWLSATTVDEQTTVTVHGQLLYREFFYCVAFTVNNFTKIKGNKICRQISWNQSEVADEMIKIFRNGMTGFPWIDASIRKMKQDGWIHHLCRMSLATFLTIGHMWCSWETGQQIFEEFLIDADYALNAGNFMWVTGSAFSNRGLPVRTLDPIKLAKFWDPEGKFIRAYIPELRNMPLQYIFEPWLAPLDVQEMANCRIGADYPKPFLDHKAARAKNLHKIEELNESFNRMRLTDSE